MVVVQGEVSEGRLLLVTVETKVGVLFRTDPRSLRGLVNGRAPMVVAPKDRNPQSDPPQPRGEGPEWTDRRRGVPSTLGLVIGKPLRRERKATGLPAGRD